MTLHAHRSGVLAPLLAAVVWLAVPGGGGAAQGDDYALRPEDTVVVTVADQPDLSNKYTVDQAGNVLFPLVGKLPAAGLTASALTEELTRRLGEFLTEPEVSVEIERTKRVFVFGGVTSPGMYELTANMTLIELLARAGYGGASEALIIRSKDALTPALPGPPGASDEADVIRVNLREFERDLEAGRLSRNVILEEGDTIFVPRFDPNRVYVSGQVRTPGAYSVPEGTTVLQALTLAGGPTPDAALGRVRILRVVDGNQRSFDAELDDIVQPRDTILVPERFF